MRAVRFVYNDIHSVGMGKLYDCFNIRANTVIGWVDDKHGLGIRITFYTVLKGLDACAKRNTQPVIYAGVGINRNNTRYDR